MVEYTDYIKSKGVRVSAMPSKHADEYTIVGDAIVTFGDLSVNFGTDRTLATFIAEELNELWRNK